MTRKEIQVKLKLRKQNYLKLVPGMMVIDAHLRRACKLYKDHRKNIEVVQRPDM